MPATPSEIRDRRAILFDADLELKASGAVSATGSTTGVAFAPTKANFYEVILQCSAYTSYSAGTAEWVITVEASDTLGSGYTTLASFTPVGTATQARIPLSGQYVQAKEAGALYLRCTATKTGSPGNLTYAAYVNAAMS